MKIGINLLDLSMDKFGGVEQYLKNLIRELARDKYQVKLFLFLTRRNKNNFPDRNERIVKVSFDKSWDPAQIYRAIHQYQLDLWFCPLHKSYLPNIPVPTVVAIHDALHTFYPEFVPGGLEENNQYYKNFEATFDAIITVSEFSKKSIAERLQINEEKIHAIYPGVPKEFYRPQNERLKIQIRDKYQLPDGYALYPASYNPHKNHLNLLKALVILQDKYHKRLPLVLTGFWYKGNMVYQSVVDYIKDNGLKNQVKILGYIPQKEMPYLYANSKFLVFPSLFEGFGFPLVEAMRTNTPIVCSKGGSIPEVVDESALHFNPHAPEDIALKMHKVLDPATRNKLIRKGRERAKAFSWEKCARETLNVFRSVLPPSKDGNF